MKRLCLWTAVASAITENRSYHQTSELLELKKTSENINSNPFTWQVTRLRTMYKHVLCELLGTATKHRTGITGKCWWHWAGHMTPVWDSVHTKQRRSQVWLTSTAYQNSSNSSLLGCWKVQGFKIQLILLQVGKKSFQRLVAVLRHQTSGGLASWEAVFCTSAQFLVLRETWRSSTFYT